MSLSESFETANMYYMARELKKNKEIFFERIKEIEKGIIYTRDLDKLEEFPIFICERKPEAMKVVQSALDNNGFCRVGYYTFKSHINSSTVCDPRVKKPSEILDGLEQIMVFKGCVYRKDVYKGYYFSKGNNSKKLKDSCFLDAKEYMGLIIKNESHKLLAEQKALLDSLDFSKVDYLEIPKEGLTISEMDKLFERGAFAQTNIVFVSPVPYLLARTACNYGFAQGKFGKYDGGIKPPHQVYIFHNDYREKKELLDGRTISVVAETGWQLIKIKEGEE